MAGRSRSDVWTDSCGAQKPCIYGTGSERLSRDLHPHSGSRSRTPIEVTLMAAVSVPKRPMRIRLWRLAPRVGEVGLGTLVRRLTTRLGVPFCSACARRAAYLDRRI